MSKDKKSGDEPIKVDKWDGSAIKNALDDAIREILTRKLEYVESHALMDGRLAISGVAVSIALLALLWDYLYPFPLSRPMLIFCVLSYFVLMGILTLYTTYKEKGIFVKALQRDPAGFEPDSVWEASSYLKRFDDMYSLTLSLYDGKTRSRRETKIEKSVSRYFDENGVLCHDVLEPEILKLHASIAQDKKEN